MHRSNSIVIHNDCGVIFETVADLRNWTRLLPHYRWIKTLSGVGDERVIRMAARRGWIPIRWTSRFRVDRQRREIHFQHLKSFTKGMTVVWSFTPVSEGVLVKIDHDLELDWPVIGPFVAKAIIGRFFIHPVASKTLAAFKAHLEDTAPESESRRSEQMSI